MKKVAYYTMNAVVTQFVSHFDANDIAERIANNLNDPNVRVEEAKASGYRFKVKRDSSIDTADVAEAIMTAMREMIEEDDDGFVVELVERFEFQYDPGIITLELIDHTMTIKRDQKTIYVEIDI